MDSFSYDAAGNLLNDGTNNYTYDAENRIKSVNGATTYTYNANGQMIVYCLLLVYCCLWVPWLLVSEGARVRIGYGWLWIGPSNFSYTPLFAPDVAVIGLRFISATAISGAAFLLAGIFRSQQH
jgi:hypothetical protein